MSRRRRPAGEVSHPYGAVRFVCPRGHRCGMAVLHDTGRFVLSRVSVDDNTIRLTCDRCSAAGERRDLQASLSKVRTCVEGLLADEHAGVSDYPVGGTLIH